MEHHLLIDTCVWIDLASDSSADEILARLEDLIATTHCGLVVPQVVREEFDRHKADCTEKLVKKLSVRVNEMIQFAKQFAEESTKDDLIAGLEVFKRRIKIVANSAEQIVSRIDKLLDSPEAKKLETSDEVLIRVAKRGYEKKAPFASNKNSTADAIILESFLDFFHRHQEGQCSFSFVTLNKSDFANSKDQRLYHAELGEPFTSGKIRYSINLAEEINRLTNELPPAPRREKKQLSEEIVRRVNLWEGDQHRPGICPSCGARALVEGGWGGNTWHRQCNNCGGIFDIGESIDD